jgi:glycosyltransferase involved in cell wall biosynthesis
MRVLFVSLPQIGLGKGGFQSQVLRTAEVLERLGVEIVRYDPWTDPMDHVDLCHFLGPCGSMAPVADAASARGIPIVSSPVLGTRNAPGWQTSWKVRLSGKVPGFYTNYALLKRILGLSSRVLALTGHEASTLHRLFGVPESRIRTVPNGIDPKFSEGTPELFQERYGLSDFVLQVGAFHPIKNQMATIHAMTDMRIPLVLVGDELLGREDYVEHCRSAAGENVLFTGRIDHDDPLLASAYAASSVFVLPSLSEVMPLSLYEAALAGCRLVVSKNVPVWEGIEEFVDRANPRKPGELRALIRENLDREPTPELRKTVLRMPRWDDVGKQILAVYRDLLELEDHDGPEEG